MMLGARTGAWSGKDLPYDAEVEWIKAYEGACIDLDFFTGSDIEIVLCAKFPQTQRECDLIGNQDDSTGRFIVGSYKGYWFAYSKNGLVNDGNATTNSILSGTICNLDVIFSTTENYKSITYNGHVYSHSPCTNISNENYKMRIFKNNFVINDSRFESELYSMKIIGDGFDLFDLKCVRVGSVGCLYDNISGKLFGNSGTGAFVVGPDKT